MTSIAKTSPLPSTPLVRWIDHVRDTVMERVHSETPSPRLVIYDLSTSPHVDLHTAQVLGELATELGAAGIRTRVVEARASVRDTLRAQGLEEKLGNINRLSSIVDVVDDFEKQGLSKEGAAEDNAKSK